MEIPEEHKRTIRRLVNRNKAVAQATCDVPHMAPGFYLREGREGSNELPYCGCFVGVYAWMQQCSLGKEVNIDGSCMTQVVADHTGISENAIDAFGRWCVTREKDRLAVEYTIELLANA